MATEGKIPFLGFSAGAVKFLTLFGFSPRAVTTEAAYLVDFIEVDTVTRFVTVPTVGGRFVTVRAER